jgi:hypothetical protein
MSKQENTQRILKAINLFFESFDTMDEELFKSITHPEVRTVNVGNSNEAFIFGVDEIIKFTIQGLKKATVENPGFYARREITEVKHIEIHEVIACAEIYYKMIMPGSVGIHTMFLHLVNEAGKWQVVNIIDRGIEETE